MPFYERRNVRIRYEDAGSGLPLLVTPGDGLNSAPRNWSSAVWYRQVQPTCADAIAVVRQPWWTSTHVYMSAAKPDIGEIPSALLNCLTETLCSAA